MWNKWSSCWWMGFTISSVEPAPINPVELSNFITPCKSVKFPFLHCLVTASLSPAVHRNTKTNITRNHFCVWQAMLGKCHVENEQCETVVNHINVYSDFLTVKRKTWKEIRLIAFQRFNMRVVQEYKEKCVDKIAQTSKSHSLIQNTSCSNPTSLRRQDRGIKSCFCCFLVNIYISNFLHHCQ